MSGTDLRRHTAAVMLIISLVAGVSAGVDLRWSGRPLVTLAYFTFVPGCTLLLFRRLGEPLMEVSLGVALSAAVGTAVALSMVAVDQWHPSAALTTMAIVTASALIWFLWRGAPEEVDR